MLLTTDIICILVKVPQDHSITGMEGDLFNSTILEYLLYIADHEGWFGAYHFDMAQILQESISIYLESMYLKFESIYYLATSI